MEFVQLVDRAASGKRILQGTVVPCKGNNEVVGVLFPGLLVPPMRPNEITVINGGKVEKGRKV